MELGWAANRERGELADALGWLRCTLASCSFLPYNMERPLWCLSGPLAWLWQRRRTRWARPPLPSACHHTRSSAWWCCSREQPLPPLCSHHAQLTRSASLRGCCHQPHTYSCSCHRCCFWLPWVPWPAVGMALSASGARAHGRGAVAAAQRQLPATSAAATWGGRVWQLGTARSLRWQQPPLHSDEERSDEEKAAAVAKLASSSSAAVVATTTLAALRCTARAAPPCSCGSGRLPLGN